MEAPKRMVVILMSILIYSDIIICRNSSESVTPEEAKHLRHEVREMFYHAFDGYMEHAFPHDELKPLSCEGEDTLGGYALTLVDSLDTLALLGDHQRFIASVEWIGKNLRFDINKTVSVFETTIRILGGLLSAHLIANDYNTGMRVPSYDGELLHLAEDLARRMLPAFDTPTGIPYGSVNLLHGVDENESKITSTAGGGTLTLEFGVLSRLTNDSIFEQVTKNAVRGIWARRSKINLVGAHIDVFSGEWTQKDAGIGTSIDSFYEYLLKAYLLFGDEEYLFIFQEAYRAAMQYLYNDPWYVEVNMNSAALVWPLFNSLQAFWPGLQVLAGDIEPAIRTHAAFFSVWKRYGFTPEGFNLATLNVQRGQKSYPLRPELIESTYWLYKATRDPRYLDAGRDMLASLQSGARCTCGYCHISDVEFHTQEDHMESFFLAETVKYLWLLFDLAAGPDNLVENGPYKYIFSTEGHLLPATPQISLVREHCFNFGAYCRSSDLRLQTNLSHIAKDNGETNRTGSYSCPAATSPFSHFDPQSSPFISGLIQGLYPGITHGQRFGIQFLSSAEEILQSHSAVVVSNHSAEGPFLPGDQIDLEKDQESSDRGSEAPPEEESPIQRLTNMVQIHSVVVVSKHTAESSPCLPSDQIDLEKDQESSDRGSEAPPEEDTSMQRQANIVQSHSVVVVSEHTAEPSPFLPSDQIDPEKDQQELSDQRSEAPPEEYRQQAKLTELLEGR